MASVTHRPRVSSQDYQFGKLGAAEEGVYFDNVEGGVWHVGV
ncbi:hypothetical protein [Paenibacillus amylolyticus]|nr:hypothetical protein [Paenibacillus amylolyticus]